VHDAVATRGQYSALSKGLVILLLLLPLNDGGYFFICLSVR